MKLKAFLESLDGVDEKYHDLYEKTDEGFVFTGTDEADFKASISKFRDRNINQGKELDGAKATLTKLSEAGITEESLEEWLELKRNKDKPPKEGEGDDKHEQQLAAIKEGYDTRISALETALENERKEKAEERKHRTKMETESSAFDALEAAELQLKKNARADFLSRVHGAWAHSEDGALTCYRDARASRLEERYDDKGKPLAMTGWIGELVGQADHLFENGAGGGSAGNNKGGPAGSKQVTWGIRPSNEDLKAVASGEKVAVRE